MFLPSDLAIFSAACGELSIYSATSHRLQDILSGFNFLVIPLESVNISGNIVIHTVPNTDNTSDVPEYASVSKPLHCASIAWSINPCVIALSTKSQAAFQVVFIFLSQAIEFFSPVNQLAPPFNVLVATLTLFNREVHLTAFRAS